MSKDIRDGYRPKRNTDKLDASLAKTMIHHYEHEKEMMENARDVELIKCTQHREDYRVELAKSFKQLDDECGHDILTNEEYLEQVDKCLDEFVENVKNKRSSYDLRILELDKLIKQYKKQL